MTDTYFNLDGKKSKSQTYRQRYKGYRIYINEDTIANIYAVHLYKNGDLICNACRGHAGELCVFTKGYKKLYKHKGSYVIPFSDKTWTAKLLDK